MKVPTRVVESTVRIANYKVALIEAERPEGLTDNEYLLALSELVTDHLKRLRAREAVLEAEES